MLKYMFKAVLVLTMLLGGYGPPVCVFGQSGAEAHAATIQLPKTGQTTCYNSSNAVASCAGTGDDGDKLKGVAWSSARLVNQGNGTVRDDFTGLVWLSKADCIGAKTWGNWPAAVNALVSGNGACSLTDGSAAGAWRLPNRNELLSLADYQQSSATWLNSNGFSGFQGTSTFWTSDSGLSDQKYTVNVGYGPSTLNAITPATTAYYVLPVRNLSATIGVVPASNDFGSIAINDSSASQTFTLSNSGLDPLAVSSIALSGGDSALFTLNRGDGTGGSCGATPAIAPAGSCTVSVTFTPDAAGAKATALAIASNDPSTPAKSVTLTGTGALPTFTISTPVTGNGSISCTPSAAVYQGGSTTCTATPAVGYYLASVTVDGTPVPAAANTTAYSQPFNNVVSAHSMTAAFKANYTVSYDGNGNNGGTAPADAACYPPGATVTVPGNTGTLAKIGYTFAGWNSVADGSGTNYPATATFAMGSGNVTLYAKWTVNSYAVTFNGNGGSAVGSQSVLYNGTATAPADPAKTGYAFVGWYSDSALTSPFVFATAITADTTLYAKWRILTLLTHGGDISPATDPATWTGGTDGTTAYIGYNTGDGSLGLYGGSTLSTNTGYLGYAAGKTGSVTVDGTGSQWTNSIGNLTLGNYGAGILTIKNGGTVSVPGTPDKPAFIYLGNYSGSSGAITVDGAGSKLTGYLTVGSSSNRGYTYSNSTGTLSITNGGYVSGGVDVHNTSAVTVDGTNSRLEGTGYNTVNNGSLTITNGGYVGNAFRGIVGRLGYGTATAIVDGAGSKWINGDSLSVADSVSTTTGLLYITNGGYVSNTNGYVCTGALKGSVAVAGAGSQWVNSDLLTIGFFSGDTGIVTIGNGGAVSAPAVTIGSVNAVLSSDVRATLNVGGGAGTLTNTGGTVRMVAGAGVANGAYTPINAGTWTNTGTIQVLGGAYDATAHTVTVSSAATTGAGAAATFDLAQTQRVLVSDPGSGQSVGAAFHAATTATSLTFGATPISGAELTALQGVISKPVFGGWDFAASGYSSGDPVYLSLFVGPGHSLPDLTVWRYDGATATWSKYAADDLVYDGTYAGFTVTRLGSYAISAGVTGAGVPTGLTAVPGNGQVTLTFSPPASDGGSAVTGYSVSNYPVGGVDGAAGTLSLNHTITGLSNAENYTFTLTATSAAGPGVPVKISAVPFTTPDAPTEVTAVGGNAKATVSFANMASPSDGGSSIIYYTVTSNPAGGVDSNAGSFGTTHTITGLTNGQAYTFTVTATNAAGAGPASAASNSVTPLAPPTYTVSYLGNGSSGGGAPTDSGSYLAGATVAVSGPGALTRTGYSFAGWNSASDGSGTGYAAGASFALSGSVTLYAQWTANVYSVTFNSNGGSAVTAQNVAYGGSAGQPGAPTKTGNAFVGWYADSGLTTPFNFSGAITANTSVYAKWQPLAYTLNFAAGSNGTVSGALSQTVNYGASTSTVTAAAASGYHFLNWSGTAGFSSTANPLIVGNVAASQTITANFADASQPMSLNIFSDNQAYVVSGTLGNSSNGGTDYANASFYSKGAMMISAYLDDPAVGKTARSMESIFSFNTAADLTGTAGTYAPAGTGQDVIGMDIATAFNNQYGAGKWAITSASVTLASNWYTEGVQPNNADFNKVASGAFALKVLGNDPVISATTTWNTLQAFLPTTTATSVGTFQWNAVQADPATNNTGTEPTVTYNLTLNDNVVAKLISGKLTIYGVAADDKVGYVFNTKNRIAPQLTVTAEALVAPGAPSGATAAPGDARATVAFAAPTATGNTPITGYTVVSNPAGGVDSSAGSTGLSHLVTGLSNGVVYTFTVFASNAGGSGAASAPSNGVTPLAPITVPGAPTVVTAAAGNGRATVSFTAPTSTGGSAVTGYTATSSPDNITASGTTSPITVTGLTNGTAYTFTVTAGNAAGSGASSTASNSVTPWSLTPAIGVPSATKVKSGATVSYVVSYSGADSVTLATGNVTLNRSGTANGQISVGGSGTTSRTVTISNISGDGTLGITVAAGTATAASGAISATSSGASATCTVDSTAPTLTVTALGDGTITSNNTLTVTGAASDANGIQDLTVNGATVIPDAVSGAFNTAVTLAPGANTITVTATDSTGNQTTDSRSIVYDHLAPTITFSAPTPAGGSYTGQQAVTFTGTISEPGTVQIRVGSGAFQAAIMGNGGTSFTYQAVLALGQNTIEVMATDLVNDGSKNSSTESRTITFDNIAPALAITDPSGDMTTAVSGYLLSGTVSDQYSGTPSVDLKIDGASVSPSPGVVNGAFQQLLTLTTGKTYSVTVTATDAAGNSSTVQRNIVYRPPTVADSLRALQIAVGLVAQTPADSVLDVGPMVDGKPHADGVIDVSDAITLLRRVVGLVSW